MVGFNRRWSPAVRAAQRVLADVGSPKLVVYRIAAGQVPDGHWYGDRRQGGRLLGEVCHFIDTAQALIGADIDEAVGLAGGGGPAAAAGDDVVVSLSFADGSLATIGYSTASPTAGKEWIEVVGGSHRLVISDFRCAEANGKTLWKGRQDKGHLAQAAAFLDAVKGGPTAPTGSMLATMHATIRACEVTNRG
jgi:predicted dehydrogenase